MPNFNTDDNQACQPSTETDGSRSSPYLTVPEAADYLRCSKNYLDKLRVSGGGPEFFRLARKKVVYRKDHLEAWMADRRYGSTTEYGG